MISHIGFQSLLSRKFYSTDDHKVKQVAAAMGLSLSTFYNYIEGVTYFPVDLVAPLYNATLDTEFLTFILDSTDQRLTCRETAGIRKPVTEEGLDVAAAAGGLVDTVHKALSDGNLTIHEKRAIALAIEKAHAELEELRKSIKEG